MRLRAPRACVDFSGVHRARRRVQRHVEEERAAAGRKRPAAGGRALPLRSPGLVEMHVHVDDAREHEQPVRVDLFPSTCEVRPTPPDRAVINRQVCSVRVRSA